MDDDNDNSVDYTIDCSRYDYDDPQSEVDNAGLVLQQLFEIFETKKSTDNPNVAIKLNTGPVTITFHKDTETTTTEATTETTITETATTETATTETATTETATTETATTETVDVELSHIES
jgi:hypothetical protein